MVGTHHGYLTLKDRMFKNQKSRAIIANHELIHTQLLALPCTKGEKNGHMTSGILGPDPSAKIPKALYGNAEPGCPDLKDSVYLTPTSENPYNPLPIACAMGQAARGILSNENFVIPAKYSHKKLVKYIEKKRDWWCTYKFNEEANEDSFKIWKK